jgi:hypothetical protein
LPACTARFASGSRLGPSLVMLSWPVWPRGHSSVLGLLFEPVARRLAGLSLLASARGTARLLRRQGVQLDLRVGAQQVGRQALGVHAEGKVQPVVDDVLGQVEAGVEDVAAGGPADLDTVLVGDALFAGGVGGERLEVLRVEQAGRRPGDTEPSERDAAGQEAHRAALRGGIVRG